MSIHRSLKSKSGALSQHRNVLTRAERIAKLSEVEKFDPEKNSALGIVKVRSIKVSAGKKPSKKAGEEAAGGAAPAAGAKAAPAAKAAAGAGAKKK
jgi:small basic protein (TIGR04137 family)